MKQQHHPSCHSFGCFGDWNLYPFSCCVMCFLVAIVDVFFFFFSWFHVGFYVAFLSHAFSLMIIFCLARSTFFL
jgi:hypothetical protein